MLSLPTRPHVGLDSSRFSVCQNLLVDVERGHGYFDIPMRTGRISALRELAAQAPAPVITDTLGFHHTITHRQHINAGATWSRYAPLAARDKASP